MQSVHAVKFSDRMQTKLILVAGWMLTFIKTKAIHTAVSLRKYF